MSEPYYSMTLNVLSVFPESVLHWSHLDEAGRHAMESGVLLWRVVPVGIVATISAPIPEMVAVADAAFVQHVWRWHMTYFPFSW